MPQDEIGIYLKSLIEHSEGCLAADCPHCRMLRTIYDVLRRQIFGSVPFTPVTQKSAGGEKSEASSTGS